MKINFLTYFLLIGMLMVYANIRWSPQATQQVNDWANGNENWSHRVNRERGPNGRYR